MSSSSITEPQRSQLAADPAAGRAILPWQAGHSAIPPADRPSQTLSSTCPSVSLWPAGRPLMRDTAS